MARWQCVACHQEELSARLCSLLKAFGDNTDAFLDFVAAYFRCQANEWDRLDRWRIDKYMMVSGGGGGEDEDAGFAVVAV